MTDHRWQSLTRLDGLVAPVLATVLGAAAYVPLLLNPGFLNTRSGGDSPFLLVRLQQMVVALHGGVLPVRWMADAAYGLGYPFFNYYAPLSYYFATLAYFFGMGYIGALKATQVAGFVVAGLAMYRLASDTFGSRPAGLLASLAYTFAPFHLVNVYVRGDSLGEFWAFAFYPLVVLALRRLCDRPTLPNTVWLGLTYAGLTLSHNLSAFMFTPVVLLYALVLPLTRRPAAHVALSSRSERGANPGEGPFPVLPGEGRPETQSPRRIYVLMAFGLAMGIALSAFYWLPAVVEQPAVQLQENLTGYFDYHGHFRDDDQVQATLLFNYDPSGKGPAFAAGLVQAGLALAGAFVLILRWARQRHIDPEPALALLITLGSTWLITSWSAPVWSHIRPLQFVQFPWRFLSIQAFGTSLLAGALVSRREGAPVGTRQTVARWLIALIAGGVSLWAGMAHLPVEFLPITDTDVTPERLALYEWFTGNIGSTIRAEYLPAGVTLRPYSSANFLSNQLKAPPNVVTGEATARLVSHGPADDMWQVDVASAQAELAFNTLWFPGWRATVDGQPTPVTAVPGSGLIGLALPAGRHSVHLSLTRTAPRLVGEIVSLLALLLIAGLSVLAAPRRPVAVVLASTLLSMTWGGTVTLHSRSEAPGPVTPPPPPTIAATHTDPGMLSWNFEHMPYLHPNPDGQAVGSLRLRSYTLSPDAIAPGDRLGVTLFWDESPSHEKVTVSLTAAAVPVLQGAERVSSAAARFASTMTVWLDVPEKLSRGVYLVRVHVSNEGEVFLAPLRVPMQPAPTPSPGDWRLGDAILLTDAEVARSGGSSIQATLEWQTLRPLATNYSTSLRFLDATGQVLSSQDAQPAYGLFPTTAWQVGEAIIDRRRLLLPKGLPVRSDYRLQVIVYDPATLQPIGQAEVGGIALLEPTR